MPGRSQTVATNLKRSLCNPSSRVTFRPDFQKLCQTFSPFSCLANWVTATYEQPIFATAGTNEKEVSTCQECLAGHRSWRAALRGLWILGWIRDFGRRQTHGVLTATRLVPRPCNVGRYPQGGAGQGVRFARRADRKEAGRVQSDTAAEHVRV